MAETVHERYSVEIFRGCTRGCRFCQASIADLVAQQSAAESEIAESRRRKYFQSSAGYLRKK